MLQRKFSTYLEEFLTKEQNKILLVNGARQVGKSFIIRYIGKKLFRNFVEINLKEDLETERVFASALTTHDLYMRLSSYTSTPLGDKSDTLIFLDEIQSYPHLLTMLKFLNQESRYSFIASGSQLGVALSLSPSVPIGSIELQQMYPLDFEEFLWAMGMSATFIDKIREHYQEGKSLEPDLHNMMMKRFQYYLLIGGMPDAVNKYLEEYNIINVRRLHNDIHQLYRLDASQYDSHHRLKIRRVYDLIPSNMENKKKRIIYKQIEGKQGKSFSDYADEFDYLANSGIALEVLAVSNPKFPLRESEQKRLIKLYLNDVGLLTNLLYANNVNTILQDKRSINLGTVYESVVAQELHAHGFPLHYYDNKQKGEVDFLVDDYEHLQVLPIEIKSGKDYTSHSALTKFLEDTEYNISRAIVLSNERIVSHANGISYLPIYYIMFLHHGAKAQGILPPP